MFFYFFKHITDTTESLITDAFKNTLGFPMD